MSIIKYSEKFKNSNRLLFTTPSHSQGEVIVPDSLKMLGRTVFENDYSEIDGFDNLANPTGIIKDVENRISEIYNTKASFMLLNGSTSGMISSMLAVLKKYDKVLVARSCHISVFKGLILSRAYPIWLMPKYNKEWGIFEPITSEQVENALKKNKDIKAFIMTNPTYEGLRADTFKISQVCKKYGVILIVDEAHGALWNFESSFGIPSINLGADITFQSLHKTAGALNPSAVMHIGHTSSVDPQLLRNSLNLISTTSPSYPLMMNIEATVEYLASHEGQKQLHTLRDNIKDFVREIKDSPSIMIYTGNNDPTKLLIRVASLSGQELSEILSEEYNIEDELCNDKSVLFLTGIGTTKKKLTRLIKALKQISSDNITLTVSNNEQGDYSISEPRVKFSPSEIFNRKSVEVEKKNLLARIAMEPVINYPPGIPILLPGEVIRKEHLQYIKDKETFKVLEEV